MTLLFYLLAAHALCDYPLQGDFLARGKNHRNPIPGIPWWQCLFAHAMIQGGAVALITGNPILGGLEVSIHALTDYLKCDGQISFNQDQAIHIAWKVVYVVAIIWV